MRKNPFARDEDIPQIAAARYFTNREDLIHAFRRHLTARETEALRILVYWGVGGIGKTSLLGKLGEDLSAFQPPFPHARFNLENVRDPSQAYREVLLPLRSDLEAGFGLRFPRFDLCWSVLMARETGEAVPLVRLPPALNDAYEFAAFYLPVPVDVLGRILDRHIRQSPTLEQLVRHAGGTDEVLALRQRALQDDPLLPGELIRRFAQDLEEGLPRRSGRGCRAVLFLDAYETLWTGREAGASAQARLLDWWARELAAYCLGIGVLLVIGSRERLRWAEDDPDWEESALDQHLMGGLSAPDAQAFLAHCSIGPAPPEPPAALQEAILQCSSEGAEREGTEREVRCHPFSLALCADIVVNTRRTEGADPPPGLFAGIPTEKVARELADRFLKSLHSEETELWVEELSLTPRFDEQAALALRGGIDRHSALAGWRQLMRFSFVQPQPSWLGGEGFHRLHPTMRAALRVRLQEDPGRTRALHRWYWEHWTGREQDTLAWFHRWALDPETTLAEWNDQHRAALDELRMPDARRLLAVWAEVPLDDPDRRAIGDELWARTHRFLGAALWKTPVAPRHAALSAAIEHCQAALQVYNEREWAEEWAETQHILGTALGDLPTGDRAANLRECIHCYQAALRVRTETGRPAAWARLQNDLGLAYAALPPGDRDEHLKEAITCYQAALRVFTEAEYPRERAVTLNSLGRAYSELSGPAAGAHLQEAIRCFQEVLRVCSQLDFPQLQAMASGNLGGAYCELSDGDRGENLEKAIAAHQAALEIFTETDFPYEWAIVQERLGTAHRELPRGNPEVNLRQAVACYRAALRVLTEADFPYPWAQAQSSLGQALRTLAERLGSAELLREAQECFAASARGFRSIGLTGDASRAVQQAEQIAGQIPPTEPRHPA
jgi:tetratricopeptide (TPR) repeat protein